MLSLALGDTGSKYRQIVDQLRARIDAGVLRPEERLPSTRRLAETLGVDRSTVALAYQELWALGLLELRAGARARVRQRVRLAERAEPKERGLIRWERATSAGGDVLWRAHRRFVADRDSTGRAGAIDFRTMEIDARLVPIEPFRLSLSRAIGRHGAALFGYGDRAGFPPLRETIAERMRTQGIRVAPDEILLTNGSQHGIDLVLRALAVPGRSVVVESPTYDGVLPLIRSHGLNAIEVPMRDGGLDLDVLAAVLRRRRPGLVYTMPNFQNPTGISTSQQHRERLLALCEAHGVPILEDGFEDEMKYTGQVVLPIKSMDRRRLVIYCGTFSKVLFAGARTGWIAAEKPIVERLIAVRRFSELSPVTIVQAGLHEFCASGQYDRHVGRMHRVYRRRMQVTFAALQAHVRPEWARWREPAGGFLIWLELRSRLDGDWPRLLAAHGVEPSPGDSYFPSRAPTTCLRLSISSLAESEIVEGIQRLGHALEAAYRTRRRSAIVRGH